MDYMLRVFLVAATNVVCIGGGGYLIYMLVGLVRTTPPSVGSIIVVSIFLFFFVAFSDKIYPAYCSIFFPCCEHLDCMDSILHALSRCLRGVGSLLWRSWRARAVRARFRSQGSGSGGGSNSPQSETQGQPHLMDVLPREPPARGGAWVGAAADIPAYELRDDAVRLDDASVCVMCLGETEEGEMVKRLPMCRHMFHQHCIDQWLNGHSTCPMCRCNVFEPLPPAEMV